MSEQQSNDIGKVFRSAIDGLSMTPPKSVWENLRILALQAQVLRYQKLNRWLVLYASIVTLLLGSSIVEHFSHNTSPTAIEPITKVVYKTQMVHDTILLTNVVYRTVPLTDFESKIHTSEEQITVQSNHLPQPQTANSLNPLAYDSTFTQQEINHNNSNEVLEPYNIEHSDLTHQEFSVREIVPKPYQPFVNQLGIPALPFIKARARSVVADKPPRLKIPFKNKLSISLFNAPELGKLIVYRSTPDAFSYGNETIEKSNLWGLRASIDLSPRLSVSTGVQLSTVQFAGAVRKVSIQPELVNGQLKYLYKTVFGVAQIPTDEMTTTPAENNPISVEMEDEHKVTFINIPLSVRFNAFSVKLTKGVRNQQYMSLYGIGGINYHIPHGQLMNIEVYETNGHDYYTTLRNFTNTQAHWSYQFGIGAELEIGRQSSVWIEPYYQRTINSFVTNLPLESYLQNVGARVGFKWHF